jgi:hypothetical protein
MACRSLAALTIPEHYWPLAGDRQSLVYPMALAYLAVGRDLCQGTTTAPNIDHAVALHRTLASIRERAN